MTVRFFAPLNLIKVAILAGLLFLPISVNGQIENHLILKKNGLVDKIHFLTGDPISFIREGNDFTEEYYIQGIGTDFILVSGQEVPIAQIKTIVRYRTGFNFKGSGKALLIAAPAYLVIGAVNELFHQRGNKFNAADLVPTRGNLIVSGSLLTAGLILPSFQVRKYHLHKKFMLKIVQSDPALNR
jgi:hypothetical protein